MNNVYSNSGDIYTIRGDMCYDNKTMVTTALPARQNPQQHVLHIADRGNKNHSTISSTKRYRSRIRIPLFVNIAITVIVAVLLAALEWGLIPQTKQGFYCKDPTISFPFRGDTISMTTLLIVSTLGPLIVIILTETLRERSFGKVRARIVWNWYKEFLVVYAMVLLFTEAAKVAFGEHRPHFLSTCVPDAAHTCDSGAYVEEFKCTNDGVTSYFLVDSSRSFPSGHASVSFVAGTYSAIVVHWRMPTRQTGQFLKPFLVCLCLLWSVLCSLSRITDRRHHWWDVLAGTILGVTGAFYALFFLRSWTAKSPRTSASTTTLLDERNKDAISANI